MKTKKIILNEILGVPESLRFWVDIFSKIIMDEIESSIKNNYYDEMEVKYINQKKETVVTDSFIYETTIGGKDAMIKTIELTGISDLGSLLKTDSFKKFPLYNPNINLKVTVIPDELYLIEFKSDPSPKAVDALFGYNYSKPKLTKLGGDNLVLTGQNFDFNVFISMSTYINKNIDSIKKTVKPAIAHELLHSYETYNRIKTKEDPFFGQEGLLDLISSFVDDKKYPKWGDFLHLVYLHLYYEINARVTQLYYELLDKEIKNKEDFIRELKNSETWSEMMELENFNAKEFIENFDKGSNNNFYDILKSFLKENKKLTDLIDVWDQTIKMLNVKISEDGIYKGNLLDVVPEYAKKDPYKFFSFFERRFKKKAKYFRNKMVKLYDSVLDKD
jgi:hypothetical protein